MINKHNNIYIMTFDVKDKKVILEAGYGKEWLQTSSKKQKIYIPFSIIIFRN